MATSVTLPRLGQGMESGTIVRWLKSEGDAVEKGEPLYELDTEKVTQEVEADAGGVLLKILAGEGEEIEVGKPVAVIGEAGEEVPAEPAAAAAGSASTEAPAEVPPPRTEPAAADGDRSSDDGSGRIKASPLARRIARERGLDLAAITGTGPEGRIVAEDVERAAAGAPAAARAAAPAGEVEVEKLSQTRRTIARRLTEAWQIPVFQLAIDIDMSRATALRELLVERVPEGGLKPTITDVLTKACAAALMRQPLAECALRRRGDPPLPVRGHRHRGRRAGRPRRARAARMRAGDDLGDRDCPSGRRRSRSQPPRCDARISTAARSRSPTSACSASTSSSPS